jgi:pimeloyl-ACP methyl ester carboxylesterase
MIQREKPMPRNLFLLFLFCLLLTACEIPGVGGAPTPALPQDTGTGVAGGARAGAAPVAVRSLALTDCVLPTDDSRQVDARCGSLNVPEDRANPNGRQIALNIALIPAIKRKPAPDPLFMLAGGPGQSAVETFPAMLQALYNIHEGRDIVLVDQRGTGKSNPLQCLDPEKDENLSDQQSIERLQACPAQLKANADLRFYTTEIAMQDLDAVRAALGYETINLYGASYGTRAALTYLRTFPKRVRTVTLDAVTDPGFVILLDAAGDGQKSLDFFFERCAADAACHSTFPNLKTEFDGLLERLDAAPATITIPHPVTNQALTLTVTRNMLTNMIFNTLYAPDLVATLPLDIHVAYADGNYIPLISQAYLLDAGLADGMFYAVICAEDAPLITAATAEKLSQGSVFGNRTLDFVKVCAQWPKGSVSATFRDPVVSNVPALIFSGEADPITPPWHAEKVAASFSNELHLVFKGMGHGNLSSRCSANLLEAFIESASVAGLETGCVSEIAPPPFFVNFNGPRP